METQTETGKEIGVVKTKHEGIKTTGGQLARLEPKSFGELEHMAMVLAKSDIVPKELIGKAANVLLVLMFGNEIGLTAAQSLQNVMVVNGRPSLWGDAVMGLVVASEFYEWSKDSYDEKTKTAIFTVKRKGQEPLTRTFSEQDAKDAKLDSKPGPWQQYKRRMLFHRARSWALRDTFPDVLKGLRYFEEESDIVNLESGDGGKTYEMPKAKDAPTAATVETTVEKAQSEPKASFLIEKVTTTEKDGKKIFCVYIDGTRYETPDASIAKTAKEWCEAKTPMDFVPDGTQLIEIRKA